MNFGWGSVFYFCFMDLYRIQMSVCFSNVNFTINSYVGGVAVTLIITTLSPRAVTMVGDRRLTLRKGEVYREDATKQGYLCTPDACALYGYTGIAECGDWRLHKWIGEEILDIVKNEELPLNELMGRLAERATKLFKTHTNIKKLDKSQLHTTIIFAGYMGNSDPFYAIVSNFEDAYGASPIAREEFVATFARTNSREDSASATFLTGNVKGLKFERWSDLNQLLLSGKPIKALLGKSQALLSEASNSTASGNTIGKSRMVAHMKAPISGVPSSPSSKFVGDKKASRIYALDMINTFPEFHTFISDVELCSAKLSVYPNQLRNAPCSCGSGKKYKFCHGQ